MKSPTCGTIPFLAPDFLAGVLGLTPLLNKGDGLTSASGNEDFISAGAIDIDDSFAAGPAQTKASSKEIPKIPRYVIVQAWVGRG